MSDKPTPKEVRLRGVDATTNDPGLLGSRNKHNINLYQYPSDLKKSDLQHYVEFSINVRGKSKYNSNRESTGAERTDSEAGLTPEGLSTVAAGGVGLTVGALGFGLGKKFLSRWGKSGAVAGNKTTLGSTGAADTAIAATAGVITGAGAANFVNGNQLLKPDTSYRISDVINLHVEGPPTVKYSMNYANKDLGTLAGIIGGGFGEGTLKSLGGVSEAAAAVATAFSKLPGVFGGTDVQSALSASSKTSLNPFKEVIFESVDFRSFGFRYKFLPKNKTESESIRAIINLFKFHMHPEMSDSKLFFIYPAEFQIAYYFSNGENTYTHKFVPCVLESMEVTYGGEQFSTFADGSPTEINMSLIFRETEIITKGMIVKSQGDL